MPKYELFQRDKLIKSAYIIQYIIKFYHIFILENTFLFCNEQEYIDFTMIM